MGKKSQKKTLSDSQIAKEIGVSRMTVFRWRSGKSRPSPLAEKILKMKGIKL
jgi:DNA-binding transcriptional regulator YiaG